MSNMKNGFSTLNRWLGKKNKEKSPAPNGKLSKSSTNLSISTANISDTSQLEYNRIAPLPAITSNAPFEQTFRITVLLPKDQLYVARLGARVPLKKLLELACDHKSLDPEKYEFRNPVDPSQVYSCDLTIGAVGLSEIRLCHKSDSYDTFNADEVMKLHRTSIIRDSLSSSEFSSRNSKHTTKTASPYSSSNSLNSMDSTGMNYTRTPISPPPVLPKSTPPSKIAAPPRKKRAAPRPPSQIVIPEKSALVIEQETAQTEQTIEALKQQQDAMSMPTTRKDYYASTPNLSPIPIDSNGNASTVEEIVITSNRASRISPSTTIVTNGNVIEYSESEYAQVVKKNARNLHGGSVQNLSNGTANTEPATKLPEPSPRKRLVLIKKKAAPAPPPRSSSIVSGEDVISIASTTLSTPGTPNTADSEKSLEFNRQMEYVEKQHQQTPTAPIPVTRESSPPKQPLQSSTPVAEINASTAKTEAAPANIPKPVPRQTTTTLLNATPETTTTLITQHSNVSKVLLNRSPTPEPRSLASDSSESTERLMSLPPQTTTLENDDNVSKQADSGIGELVPSPLPDSLPSEGSAHECKSTFESSSDDDEIIKTYNFKLGKTIVKNSSDEPAPAQTLEELRALQAADSGEVTPATLTHENTPSIGVPSSWNFAIPISPPPNFADKTTNQVEPISTDAPITPKIVERPVLNFDGLSTIETSSKDTVDDSNTKVQSPIEKFPRTPLPSPSSPINEIIDELSTILNENRMDTLIKRHDEQSEIQSAKPNTLTNFSISTLTTTQQITTTVTAEAPAFDEAISSPPPTPQTVLVDSVTDEEKLYKKRSGIVNGPVSGGGLKQLKSVVRADSFHTTTSTVNDVSQQNSPPIADSTANGLNSRSASYLSLSKLDQNGGGLNRRRSSSELSIGESPSLQSLEVIKTILNSRKNSLANSSDGESKTPNAETEKSKILNVECKQAETEIATVSTSTTKSTETTKPKEPPKIYRYSGPPSINFSTWSERPKVQVAIKNEGDYIFGGKNAGTQSAAVTRAEVELRSTQPTVPRQQRATMHVMNSEVQKTYPPTIAPKPTSQSTSTSSSTTERMGIPEKEYRVPLTVKPLRDVTVESVEIRTSKFTEPNISKIMLNSETATINKDQFTQVSNTSTLPRAGHSTNRFSTPVKSTNGVNLLRSTSITQLEQRNSTQNNATSSNPAPFGQNTLRKTGLKEKILAKEEQAQSQQTAVTVNSTKSTPIVNGNAFMRPNYKNNSNNNTIQIETHSTANTNTAQSTKSIKTFQSAKLELKLQEPMQISIRQNGTITPTRASPSTPKSAPPAPVPPVPPMPILKSATLRSQSANAATTPTSGDPRDALLEAIRNFKRAELNRV